MDFLHLNVNSNYTYSRDLCEYIQYLKEQTYNILILMIQTYICICLLCIYTFFMSMQGIESNKLCNSQFGTAKTKAMGTGSSRWWVGRDEGVWGDGRGERGMSPCCCCSAGLLLSCFLTKFDIWSLINKLWQTNWLTDCPTVAMWRDVRCTIRCL